MKSKWSLPILFLIGAFVLLSIAGCGGAPVTGLDPTQLMNAPLVAAPPCDQVDGRLAGLSLAAYNALISAVASTACLIAARRAGSASPPSSPRTT